MNYFELFALPQGFELDGAALASRYRELQRAVHPDKFAAASDRERMLAVHKTAEINDAFETLKSPLSRAEYLLRLNGIELRGETATVKDPLFLMQQMEWREALAELPGNADPMEGAMALEREFVDLRKTMLAELASHLDGANWPQAADTLRKLKFVDKLEQELSLLEEQWEL
ncbi:co-chaperone HscB [Ferrimonas marina]|uniref:Co-chaperone protein HscB homolog n=1 Tax=Ferrimonas marina TaxID=299255 RepID=A0A1M5S503_9GAMM|nr:co-chaperone HscB [Ferrimonas marina]SHH33571.1 Co-chaperone protein HscB [Ferrimonas marina]